jgi:TRAP-type C4-dicarboxylate transport system permease small subunit
MTESDYSVPQDPAGRALHALAYALAMLGGALIAALGAMVVVSVVGRALFTLPVPGDFELVAMGTAIGICLFLPYCHLRRGNVIVDLFLARASRRVRAACDLCGSVLLGVMAGMLAWRSVLGAMDLWNYGEVSMILAIPVWWAFPFVVISLGLLALCCLYTAGRDLRRIRG